MTAGFTHYAFWYLCPACVARVQAAGPWKIRRAQANQARVDALKARFLDHHRPLPLGFRHLGKLDILRVL